MSCGIATEYILYVGMKNILAQTYGPGSKCFDAVDKWTLHEIGSSVIYHTHAPGCGCYQASLCMK